MSIVMLTMSLARSFFNILRQEQDFMQIGKMINRISNRLRRRSVEVQKSVGISGAQGNILDYILVDLRTIPFIRRKSSTNSVSGRLPRLRL